jgi:hypothetical protein
VHLGDVVDQFHDENRLAHAGAAEQADLAALGVGGQQVDHLDAGDEDFGFRRLFDEVGRGLVDGALFLGLDRAAFVHGLADDVQDAAQRRVPTGTVIGPPVSVTAWPRTRPSVASMAMVRTVFRPGAAPLPEPGACRCCRFPAR